MPPCHHFQHLDPPRPRTPEGCEDCLAHGGRWVHLRVCLVCGHVGCCDSSPGKHATAHHRVTGHPVVRSFEPGERWGWCFEHEVAVEPAPGVEQGSHRP